MIGRTFLSDDDIPQFLQTEGELYPDGGAGRGFFDKVPEYSDPNKESIGCSSTSLNLELWTRSLRST